MSDPGWPKCSFHNIEGHMIGSPTCQRMGGPAYKEPPMPKSKPIEDRPDQNEPPDDYYTNFVDGRGY